MSFEITKEKAKKLYGYQPGWFKEELEKAFEKECFRKIDFKDLKTFNDLCIVCNTTKEEFEKKLSSLPISEQTKSFEKMEILSDAINQGWIPDHCNSNQKKWFPVFKVSHSGFCFSRSVYSYDYTTTYVGSRFCFETEQKSDHAGKQFTKLFQEFITTKETL
jgi:hypothetical protein